jgi:phage tail tube protein FII
MSVDWEEIFSYTDLNINSDPKLKAVEAVDYYGGGQLGEIQMDMTREEVEAELGNYGIKF